MNAIKHSGTLLIVIAVLAVMIASVVEMIWPILIVGIILVGIYRLMTKGMRF